MLLGDEELMERKVRYLNGIYFLLSSRYKRVYSIGSHAITTYNPQTLEVTNQVLSNCVQCSPTVLVAL